MLGAASAQADPTKAREDVQHWLRLRLRNTRKARYSAIVWKRPGLSLRDRSVVTLAALIARNQTVEMPFYLSVALDNGVKPAEISEIITHLAFYSGWGNAISAVAVAKDVFAERKIAADQLPAASPNLLPLNEAAEADRAKRVGDLFGPVFPGVVQYTTDVLFRDLWLRPGTCAARSQPHHAHLAFYAGGPTCSRPCPWQRTCSRSVPGERAPDQERKEHASRHRQAVAGQVRTAQKEAGR